MILILRGYRECVCVCVCVREGERVRRRGGKARETDREGGGLSYLLVYG